MVLMISLLSNMTVATCRAEVSCPSGAPELTLAFVSNTSIECRDDDVYDMLFLLLNTNNSDKTNSTDCLVLNDTNIPGTYEFARLFYAYATPVILIIGIMGNSLSLTVFLSKNMRHLSASSYLAALSISDLLVLFLYVTVEWLKRGLVFLVPGAKMNILEQNGICQVLLYTSYALRCLSPWLVTAFTVERYIGVCHPLYRRYICSTKGSRRIIFGITTACCIIVIYKPVLSGVYLSHDGIQYCTGSRDHDFLSFVLDSTFALLITLVPFIIISILNILIMRKLCLRNSKFHIFKHKHGNGTTGNKPVLMISDDTGIRLEFTLILFTISFCFITFNAPYFIVWFRNFLYSKHLSKNVQFSTYDVEYWQGILYITRTIFYMNYCINFFLYSITGMSFRREVKSIFTGKARITRGFRASRSSPTNQSWL